MENSVTTVTVNDETLVPNQSVGHSSKAIFHGALHRGLMPDHERANAELTVFRLFVRLKDIRPSFV